MSESIGEVGAAYRGVRERMTSLIVDREETARLQPVPGCPNWRVHDLVAHMAGVVDDIVAGRLEGVGSDAWTAAQVDPRRERPTLDLLEDWAQTAPQVEAMLDSLGPPGNQLVMDAVSHEHDLRGAIGAAGARDSDAIRIGMGWLLTSMTRAATAAGHPGLRLRESGGREWRSGDSDPTATVTSNSFELLRAASGRRTEAEIRALDWEGEVDAVLPAFSFGPFSPRSTSLGE